MIKEIQLLKSTEVALFGTYFRLRAPTFGSA